MEEEDVRPDRFMQAVEDIEIVSRQPGPRVTLTQEQLAEALRRVPNGEDPMKVAEEYALIKVAEEEGDN